MLYVFSFYFYSMQLLFFKLQINQKIDVTASNRLEIEFPFDLQLRL